MILEADGLGVVDVAWGEKIDTHRPEMFAPDRVAARRFRCIHQRIRAAGQHVDELVESHTRCRSVIVDRAENPPDTDRDIAGIGNRAANAFRQRDDLVEVRGGEASHEFFPAETTHQHISADSPSGRCDDLVENVVAGCVTEMIVDLLEMIDIDDGESPLQMHCSNSRGYTVRHDRENLADSADPSTDRYSPISRYRARET